MRLHVDLRAERVGMAAARRQFGNMTNHQQRSRDMWGFGSVEDLGNDTRFAIRRLKQRPAFAIAVIGILAIGIGATTAMFSAVDAAFLRPLPFRSPNELVVVPEIEMPSAGTSRQAELNVMDVRGFTDLFSQVAVYGSGAVNLSDETNPLRLNASSVTPDFFPLLGVGAVRGRLFSADELKSGSANVAVISFALWQRQYGGRDISTLTIALNNLPHRVIGVMPEGFSFPSQSDLWVPLTIPAIPGTVRVFRNITNYITLARVRRGVSSSTASAQMLARWKQHANNVAMYSDDGSQDLLNVLKASGGVAPLRNALTGDRRTALFVLLGATGLLLLVACGNVSNLLLAQAASRQREIAMRRVLGASRGRVVRQLLVESGVLAIGGAIGGVTLALGASQLINAIMPTNLQAVAPAAIDLRVLSFAVGLALATGMLFGLWPAIGSTRGDATGAIKSGEGRGATGLRAGRLRRVLVGGELALTSMLLVGALLMIRSFDHLMSQDIGLHSAQVGTLELALPMVNLSAADRLRRVDEMVTRLSNMPGIQSAGIVNDLPLSGVNGMLIGIRVDGVTPNRDTPPMRYLQASGGYFESMRIRLLDGRMFNAADDSLAPKVAIVSETVAKRFWPNQSAVGRTFHGPGASGEFTVIGVVSDLREKRLEDAPSAQLYMSIQYRLPSTLALVARSELEPAVLLRRMNEVVRSVDPGQAVFNLRMMDDVVGTAVAPRRTSTQLISLFAVLAVLLASIGVYAVVSYGVASRARELGIRSALGATGSSLLAMISREMVWTSVIGIGVGLGAAWAFAQTLQGMLYGVNVHDPLSFLLVPLTLIVPTVFATVIPASRALRVNPTEVMRADQ
ncbi:MAG: ABC transporter permease [Gemmatimonas sp.]